MLKQLNNRYWRKDGVYTDRVGAARYFIKKSRDTGKHWREFVIAKPPVVELSDSE